MGQSRLIEFFNNAIPQLYWCHSRKRWVLLNTRAYTQATTNLAAFKWNFNCNRLDYLRRNSSKKLSSLHLCISPRNHNKRLTFQSLKLPLSPRVLRRSRSTRLSFSRSTRVSQTSLRRVSKGCNSITQHVGTGDTKRAKTSELMYANLLRILYRICNDVELVHSWSWSVFVETDGGHIYSSIQNVCIHWLVLVK